MSVKCTSCSIDKEMLHCYVTPEFVINRSISRTNCHYQFYVIQDAKTKWLFCSTYLFLHPTMVFSMHSAVNCTVVGDGFVGKSCLVQKIAGGKFHQEYVATLKDNYSTKLSLNGDSFEMNITDIAGEVSKRVFS